MEKLTAYKEVYTFLETATKENKNYHLLTFYSEAINLLKEHFPLMDWVGFYIVDEERQNLYLGPYLPGFDACEEIKKGKGVCGTAYEEEKTQLVHDVRELKNYIACSFKTLSEIVVPVYNKGRIVSVLDIDSDTVSAFDEADQEELERIVSLAKEIHL